MKLGQAANEPVRGSFGIPPEMKEAAERSQAKKEEVKQPAKEPELKAKVETPVTDEDANKVDPYNILKTLGIEFTDEMFNQLLFKGFVEAEVDVIPGKLKAKFKTLTTEEHDLVDELLAEDLKNKQMTSDGFEARRSVWTMAFGVTHLLGKPICPIVLAADKKTMDKMATAKKRRPYIAGLAPIVMNTMIQKHGAMTVAINMIVSEPGEHVKNS
jgi:hypothetical protein